MKPIHVNNIEEIFNFSKLIFEGSDNSVFKVKEIKTNNYFTMKKNIYPIDINKLNIFCDKISNLNKIKNDCVIKCHNIFYENSNGSYLMYFQFDFIDHCDLFDYLTNYDLSNEIKLNITEKLIDGLSIIHDHNILHGDVKLENIMITEKLDIVYIDFDHSFDLDKNIKDQYPSFGGTFQYNGPEFINGRKELISLNKEQFKKFDIWSLGILILHLFIEESLIHKDNYYEQIHTMRHKIVDYRDKLPENVYRILYAIFDENLETRPDVKQVQNIFNLWKKLTK